MTCLDDLRLTAQELRYLATGARLLAAQAREDAALQGNPAVRGIFERAQTVYIRLAEKVERMAELAGSS